MRSRGVSVDILDRIITSATILSDTAYSVKVSLRHPSFVDLKEIGMKKWIEIIGNYMLGRWILIGISVALFLIIWVVIALVSLFSMRRGK